MRCTDRHRVTARVHADICWVNRWCPPDLRTPFGSKPSGIGREGDMHSREFCTELRIVCIKQ